MQRAATTQSCQSQRHPLRSGVPVEALSKALIPRCNSAVLSHALPHRDLLTIGTRRLIVPSD
jgi:hypothetical protein